MEARMTTVRDLLKVKGSTVWSIAPDATVLEALMLMSDRNIGAIVVLAGEEMIGIFSERDYARKVELEGRTARTTTVREIMTRRVVTVHPEQTVEDCMALMTEHRLRHLPVMQHERLLGLISIGDVVKAIISEQEFMIGQLETYIMGRRVYA
jgi:CBS domain-containing protein